MSVFRGVVAAAWLAIASGTPSAVSSSSLRGSLKQSVVPAWCQYVPDAEKQAACRGSSVSGCTCDSNVCKQIPSNTWIWNPQCCGCGHGTASTQAAELVSEVEESQALVQLEALSVPAWCHYVPDAQKQAWCRGSSASGCACDSNTCKQIPNITWMWIPQCCGCGQGAASKHAAELVSEVEQSQALVQLQALSVPAWCQYVPDAQKQDACRGSSASGCACDSNTCKQIPNITWMWNPQCCGCGQGAASKQAAELVSEVEQSQALVQLQALSVPAWCQYVPDAAKQAACRGSSASGCACDSNTCKQIPNSTWMWNPQCCGCGQGAAGN